MPEYGEGISDGRIKNCSSHSLDSPFQVYGGSKCVRKG